MFEQLGIKEWNIHNENFEIRVSFFVASKNRFSNKSLRDVDHNSDTTLSSGKSVDRNVNRTGT